jgi:hypothetical protein
MFQNRPGAIPAVLASTGPLASQANYCDAPPPMDAELTPEYVATLRRLSGHQKLRTAFAMYWSARKLKAARLRIQFPEWTEEQVQRKVKEIFLHATT